MTTLKAEFLPGGRIRLLEDYEGVPAGFVSDGASVPRFFWRVVGHPFETDAIGPSVKHDWHYSALAERSSAINAGEGAQLAQLSRAEADAQYYSDLRRNGVGVPRATAYWLGVRLFGWMRWGGEG